MKEVFRSRFQTIVDDPEYISKTGYSSRSMFVGSCFTENIGKRMKDLAYPVDVNPFGILYNPESVARGIRRLVEGTSYTEEELIENHDLWHSFDHHGRFSSPTKEQVLENINSRLATSAEFLKNSDFLFITFGTAWVYRYVEKDLVVSNCHKIPAKQFNRERLSVQYVVESYKELLRKLWSINEQLRVVFTVSPVRHWKDGAVENQRSKSVLILAIEELCASLSNCEYFPSYEIVMDELRDYRFYAADMLHLTDTAVDLIWERFETALIDQDSRLLSVRVKKIKQAFSHKPFNKFTRSHLKFLNDQLKKTQDLCREYPSVNLESELKAFRSQILEIEDRIS